MDLASYRELEAFTQFGSDLDAATQAKLNRGRRTVEVLKQPVHKPLAVQYQVLILYALTHGYLDAIAIDDIAQFQKELFDYADSNGAELLKTIKDTGNLPDTDKLDALIKGFADGFTSSTKK